MNKEDEPTYSLEDIRMVPTLCEKCGVEGQAPTFKQMIENPETPIAKMLEADGHVKIFCKPCAETLTKSVVQ